MGPKAKDKRFSIGEQRVLRKQKQIPPALAIAILVMKIKRGCCIKVSGPSRLRLILSVGHKGKMLLTQKQQIILIFKN